MIVKIQQSLFSSDGVTSVMVYDENRDYHYMTSKKKEVEPIIKLLGKRPKAYFEAELVNTRLQIGAEAPEQDW
jgi:hypothetical protein